LDFERYGQEIPAGLWPPPFIDGAESWYAAFWDLSSTRPVGMQAGRISYLAAREYCRGWLSDEEFPCFWRVMQAMDDAYLRHVNSGGEPQEFTREAFRSAFSGR
jgi:hypothetical protein